MQNVLLTVKTDKLRKNRDHLCNRREEHSSSCSASICRDFAMDIHAYGRMGP